MLSAKVSSNSQSAESKKEGLISGPKSDIDRNLQTVKVKDGLDQPA
jgi:hypothetical protein